MLFSSPFFIFGFLPICFLCFFAVRGEFRNYALLVCSVGFYFWGEPTFCLIAIASACLDYWLCKIIYHYGIKSDKAKRYMVIGVITNLLILIYYKYTNFFLSSVSQLIPGGQYHFALFDIILPIGVSFIVFEKITYLVDVYRGVGMPAKGIFKYLNYVFLFPKLLAGPIIKYHEIENQLNERVLTSDHIAEGFKRFLRGLSKKVFVADVCGGMTNQVFALSPDQLSFNYAWLGLVCFTLQIYFDFSGYSDMALGLARMFGFELKENFNMPYTSASFTEFWRRWHISLSTWIREYLYIPLGGNHVSKFRVYVNLWICFLLSGLWHGANWTFVLWGAYNGLFLILDKVFWLRVSVYFPRMIQVSLTMLFIMLGWVIFRSSDFNQIQYYLHALFIPTNPGHSYIDVTLDLIAIILIGSLLIFIPLAPGYTKLATAYREWEWRVPLEGVLFSVLGFLAVCRVVGTSYIPFLYFRF